MNNDSPEQHLQRRRAAISSSSAAAAGGGLGSASTCRFDTTRPQPQKVAPRSTPGSSSSPTIPASFASRAPRWGRARSPASPSSSPKSWNATGTR